ncbi:hypothetical protein C900_05858 [Fulvivirga imtechensis AK7]|uniref:Fibronectin type-III domain-containing protein n=1 Tax=Fulvivirga imtechensis AK7 TaxID=1237149 RepID=L8JN36_9BACT|nr:T9SS type A sorting domain-containing protein [Fulvivirga imtechensis]ELR68762.1 hypothetical protein C900_05858 [Fulvivirga imtechensis AK7]
MTEITIYDNGEVDDGGGDGGGGSTEGPTTPTNVSIKDVGEHFFRLEWDYSSSSNSTVSGYRVYLGTEYYSFMTVEGWKNYADIPIPCSGNESYSVKAYDAEGVHSGRSEFVYFNSQDDFMLENDLTADRNVAFFASNNIHLKPGFRFKAVDNDYAFYGSVGQCSSSSSGKINSYGQVRDSIPQIVSNYRPATSVNKRVVRLNKTHQEVVVYPNPSKGAINVMSFYDRPKTVHLSIINLQGKVLLEQNFTEVTSINEVIDLSHLSHGLYILRLEVDTVAYNERITIK